MARPVYSPSQTYLGDGLLSEYTFDFKIEELSQLEIIEMDDDGIETQRVRGDDVTYLSSVEFDSVNGAGTITLKAPLPSDYTLIILEANDAPTQPYEFRNKGTFTLKRIELALDFLGGAIQRLAYLAGRSIKIHESDAGTFDPIMPPLTGQAGKYLRVKQNESGFEFADPAKSFPSGKVEIQRESESSTVAPTADIFMGDTDSASFDVSLLPGEDGAMIRLVNTGLSGNSLTIIPDGLDLLLGTNESFILEDGEALDIGFQIIEGWN